MQKFPVETQHLRFPPNPLNATIYKPQEGHSLLSNHDKRVDEDLLEGLLWQWHEDSDSESTVSIRFQLEMSDLHRRQKWFRGFRRLLELDCVSSDILRREVQLARQSKSYVGKLFQRL